MLSIAFIVGMIVLESVGTVLMVKHAAKEKQ